MHLSGLALGLMCTSIQTHNVVEQLCERPPLLALLWLGSPLAPPTGPGPSPLGGLWWLGLPIPHYQALIGLLGNTAGGNISDIDPAHAALVVAYLHASSAVLVCVLCVRVLCVCACACACLRPVSFCVSKL